MNNDMSNEYRLNRISMFSDKSLEKEYYKKEIKPSIKYLKYAALFFSIIFFFTTMYDYYVFYDASMIYKIAGLRLVTVSVAIFMFLVIDRLDDGKWASLLITAFELTIFIIYFIIRYITHTISFLEETLNMIVLLILVFIVPNRWINIVFISLFGGITFFILKLQQIGQIPIDVFIKSFSDIFFLIIFSLISAFNMQKNRHKQFSVKMQLEELTTKDKLTKVYNRTKFDLSLEEWTGLSLRYNTVFSLILYDLDDYKKVNDTYGHLVGDKVLVKVCDLVSQNIRNGDIFARWGGEEFTILLPYTALGAATELAERLRKTIEEENFMYGQKLTCSFGVAEFNSTDTKESFLKRADNLMYKAKKSGKNKVES